MPGYGDDEKGQNKMKKCSKWLAGNRFEAKFSCWEKMDTKTGHFIFLFFLLLFLPVCSASISFLSLS